jgi:iron complex transport system substrate-binding protein
MQASMSSEYTPQRVVCLQPSATLTMRDIGMLDRVVACTKYCADVCPEVANGAPTVVSDSWNAQASQILAEKPDLVIASVPYQMESVAEILKAGVRFLGLAPRALSDVYADIVTIAGVMGVAERGRQIVAQMQNTIEEVRAMCARQPIKPRVFCEEWGKPIIASQPWVAELVQAASGEFIGEPGKPIVAERVAEASPDILIAAWCGAGDRVPLEKIIEQRSWQHLPAVQAGRVYCINDELLNTPATSLLHGLRAIAWALHPELFNTPTGIRQLERPRAAASEL